MVLQVEAPVHVVDAVRDLVRVRHHPQVEGLGKKCIKGLNPPRGWVFFQDKTTQNAFPQSLEYSALSEEKRADPTLEYEMMGCLIPFTPRLFPQNRSVL